LRMRPSRTASADGWAACWVEGAEVTSSEVLRRVVSGSREAPFSSFLLKQSTS